MPIKINFPCTIKSCEGKFDLKLRRERIDYKNLLLELKSGKKLSDIFPQRQMVESIRTHLCSAPLFFIDRNDIVLSDGEEFINDPYKYEEESGVYHIDYAELKLSGKKYNMILKMTRNLEKSQRQMVSFEFNDFLYENDIKMGDNETIKITNIKNLVSSHVFDGKEEPGSISFDAVNGTYNGKYGEYKAGNTLSSYMKDEILNVLKENASYLEMSKDLDYCYIDSLLDIKDEDKKNGFISSLDIDDVEISKMPFKIKTLKVASEYSYWYLYDRMINGEYLSLEDMNDIYQNEILSKDIFDQKIIDKLYNTTITLDGFKNQLSESQYSKLSYKLNVMKILLDIDFNNKNYSKATSYRELVESITHEVDYKNVNKVYMVMGYPYVDNSRNKIIESMTEFKKVFNNIIIVKKQSNNPKQQKEDLNYKNELVSMGITCYESTDILNAYHDRFMIFDMGNTTKAFLVSCEIGQFFSDTNEARGFINPIDISETVRNGKNILQYVKECK